MDSRPGGFTLPELLAVSAVAAVLAGLLVPVTGSAIAASQRAKCQSNMKQLGAGILGHAADHGGEFPWTAHAGEEASWTETLAPYTGGSAEIRACPADPQREAWLDPEAPGSSYLINNLIADPTLPGSATRLQQVANPASLPILFEGAAGRSGREEHVHAQHFYRKGRVASGTVLLWMKREIDVARHAGASNYLFADGHVAAASEAEVARWIEEDIARGTNFAQPLR